MLGKKLGMYTLHRDRFGHRGSVYVVMTRFDGWIKVRICVGAFNGGSLSRNIKCRWIHGGKRQREGSASRAKTRD